MALLCIELKKYHFLESHEWTDATQVVHNRASKANPSLPQASYFRVVGGLGCSLGMNTRAKDEPLCEKQHWLEYEHADYSALQVYVMGVSKGFGGSVPERTDRSHTCSRDRRREDSNNRARCGQLTTPGESHARRSLLISLVAS